MKNQKMMVSRKKMNKDGHQTNQDVFQIKFYYKTTIHNKAKLMKLEAYDVSRY